MKVYKFIATLTNKINKKQVIKPVILKVPLPMLEYNKIDFEALTDRVFNQIDDDIINKKDYKLTNIIYAKSFEPSAMLSTKRKKEYKLNADVALQPNSISIEHKIQEIIEGEPNGNSKIEDYYLSQLTDTNEELP